MVVKISSDFQNRWLVCRTFVFFSKRNFNYFCGLVWNLRFPDKTQLLCNSMIIHFADNKFMSTFLYRWYSLKINNSRVGQITCWSILITLWATVYFNTWDNNRRMLFYSRPTKRVLLVVTLILTHVHVCTSELSRENKSGIIMNQNSHSTTF